MRTSQLGRLRRLEALTTRIIPGHRVGNVGGPSRVLKLLRTDCEHDALYRGVPRPSWSFSSSAKVCCSAPTATSRRPCSKAPQSPLVRLRARKCSGGPAAKSWSATSAGQRLLANTPTSGCTTSSAATSTLISRRLPTNSRASSNSTSAARSTPSRCSGTSAGGPCPAHVRKPPRSTPVAGWIVRSGAHRLVGDVAGVPGERLVD
jgi:hypothetical protein